MFYHSGYKYFAFFLDSRSLSSSHYLSPFWFVFFFFCFRSNLSTTAWNSSTAHLHFAYFIHTWQALRFGCCFSPACMSMYEKFRVPIFWHGENTCKQLVDWFWFTAWHSIHFLCDVQCVLLLDNNVCVWTFIWKCWNRCGWARTFQFLFLLSLFSLFLSLVLASHPTPIYIFKMFRHVTRSVTTTWWKLFISLIVAATAQHHQQTS